MMGQSRVWLAKHPKVRCSKGQITQLFSESPGATWSSTLAVPVSEVLGIPLPAFEDDLDARTIGMLRSLRVRRPDSFMAFVRMLERENDGTARKE